MLFLAQPIDSMRLFTGMGRITGMDYRNGPYHVPLSIFHVLYLDRVA